MKTEQLNNEFEKNPKPLVGCSVKPLVHLCIVLVFHLQKD